MWLPKSDETNSNWRVHVVRPILEVWITFIGIYLTKEQAASAVQTKW